MLYVSTLFKYFEQSCIFLNMNCFSLDLKALLKIQNAFLIIDTGIFPIYVNEITGNYYFYHEMFILLKGKFTQSKDRMCAM